MKIFHDNKYTYIGIVELPLDGNKYYAFKCIKENFDPEVVLVKQAKVVSDNLDQPLYYDEKDLELVI